MYGHSDGVGWLCQDFATGKRIWRERAALGKGAIAHAGDRFVCLSEDEGDVVLIAASPDGWTRARPLHPFAADQAPQTEGQDLDAPGDR